MYYYNRFKPNEVIQIDIDPYLNISFSVSTEHSENGTEKTSVVKICKLVRNGFEHKNRFKKHTPMTNGPQRTNFSDAL